MFKKFIIAILLVISFVSSAPAQASSLEATETIRIEKATYSEVDGVFYVYSERDAEGGFWVMDFTPKKGETLTQFKKRVLGRYLIVKYIGDPQVDDEIEIIGKFIY